MKTLILFSLLTVTTFCTSTSQTILVTNERYHYQFEVPTTWTVVEEQVHINVYPPKDSSRGYRRPYLEVLTDQPNGKSIDQCFDFYLGERYEEGFEDFSKINQGRATINGLAARWMKHTCIRGGKKFTFLVYLIYAGNSFFLITARALSQSFEGHENDFDEIISSFSIQN